LTGFRESIFEGECLFVAKSPDAVEIKVGLEQFHLIIHVHKDCICVIAHFFFWIKNSRISKTIMFLHDVQFYSILEL